MPENAFIHVGTLTRPHGLRGDICVDWYAEHLDLLRGPFFLQAGDAPPRPARGTPRLHQSRPLLHLEGIDDRTAAEGLRGLRILVRRDDLPDPDADQCYLHDILGLRVVEEGTDRFLGVLDHVEFPGGQEIWSIRSPDGREILLPAVEDFIAALDLEGRCIRVTPPPGLLEIYLGDPHA